MTIRDLVDTIFLTRVLDTDQQKWLHRRLRRRGYIDLDLEALEDAVRGGIVNQPSCS